jgi:HEAT repeat protein
MSVEEAIKVLNSQRALQQRKAAIVLVEAGERAKAAVPTIIEILEREWPDVRTELIFVLIELGPEAHQAVPVLLKLTTSENFHARYLACRALGGIGKPSRPAVPRLIELLDDQIASVRRRAAEALGALGDDTAPEAIEPLIKLIAAPHETVREAAVIAVGNFGSLADPALPILKQIAFDQRSTLRPEAALSLWKLTEDADLLTPLLTDLLQTKDAPWEAAEVLAVMGPAAQGAIPALIEALEKEPSLQIRAAEALGNIGPPARPALPALHQLLEHSGKDVRESAAEAIGKIDPKAANS